MTGDNEAIVTAGVRLTHPGRVLFPGQGLSKGDLAAYYETVAELMLPHIASRPLSLVRCPAGSGKECFFQKHDTGGFPSAMQSTPIAEASGTKASYFFLTDIAGLVAGVQMGVLEFHIWGSRIDQVEKPDRLVFDLDPDVGLGFDHVRRAAVDVRERLAALGLNSFALLTGGKGIHVVAPLTPRYGWEEVKTFAEALARTIAAAEPKRYLAVATKAKRTGRIFIDYLRNARGATAIAPFSPRARKGAPVAWPVSWQALSRLKDAHPATVETAEGLLKRQRQDPWAGYFDVDQVLPLEKLKRG
jgi:bifunctional non-homologous end joining protein LigD